MLSHYLESASSFAPEIDWLIKLMIIIVGFWFVVAEVLLIGLVVRFSAKEGVRAKHIAGIDPKEKRWVAYPHYAVLLFDILIIVAATKVWVSVKQTMPPADETVKIIAQQWAWTFVHPGPDGSSIPPTTSAPSMSCTSRTGKLTTSSSPAETCCTASPSPLSA